MIVIINQFVFFSIVILFPYLIYISLGKQIESGANFSSENFQGFLSQTLRDLFALLGVLLTLEKIIRILINSSKSGQIRILYTQYVLPKLMSQTYEKEDIKAINNYLKKLNIGKLSSKNEEVRRTGIKQLGCMRPNERIFNILVKALSRENSKTLRNEILQILKRINIRLNT